ncbi:MAG: 3-hydroxyacyl-CoA dehydrogenase family protein [Anaerovoracaceae bacterium]
MNIKTVGVLGSGQMGRGTAHVAALAGYKVIFYNHRLVTLEKALKYIESELDKGIERGKTTQEDKERTLTNITITDQLSDLAKADFLIESLPEVLEIKQQAFAELDKLCGPEVIFATNTTSLSITELASVTDRPDRFIGMHFFNPVHKMKLIEMVNGLETSPETTAITKELGISFGKEVVTVKESPGFVTSRIQAIIGNEAFIMLNEGLASAEDIDKACKLGLNHPMGPFEMIDFVGLDTRLKSLEYLSKMFGDKYKPAPLHVQYVKAGRYGKKVGKGVYEYDENGKKK